MRISIQKWGNSLAFRIPGALAKEAHLKEGGKAELRLKKGNLVIVPLAQKEWTLSALLAAVKKDQLHGELDTGERMGKEAW